jgi:hypothetical protein
MATTNITSYYLEDILINHLLRNTPYTPPAHVYLGLYTGEPGPGDIGTEVSAPSYARMECPVFSTTGSSATASDVISFPTATTPWGTVGYMGIRDALVNGNLLFYGSLTSPLTVVTGNNVRVQSLGVALSGNASIGWGAGTSMSILDFILNNGTFSTPGSSVYMALGRSIITNSISNISSWIETSGVGYTRQQVAGTSAWSAPSYGATTNVNEISFTESAPANWGNIVNAVLMNSSSAFSPLLWGSLSPHRTVLQYDGIRFKPGDITVRLHTISLD